MNEEISFRKLLTANKATELRTLGTLASKGKCNWRNELEKSELRLTGKLGLVSVCRMDRLLNREREIERERIKIN
jgi:hypothetical protein